MVRRRGYRIDCILQRRLDTLRDGEKGGGGGYRIDCILQRMLDTSDHFHLAEGDNLDPSPSHPHWK